MKRLIVLLPRFFVAMLLISATCQSAFAVGVVSPPVVGAFVSSAFGARVHPTTGATDFHAGVDYAAPMNAPVKAIAAGRVTRASWKGLLGNTVEITHPNGDLSMYGHLNKMMVRVGQNVSTKTVIGLVGSTGRSTGPHLHLTIKRRGGYLDPIAYLGNPVNSRSIAIASRRSGNSKNVLVASSSAGKKSTASKKSAGAVSLIAKAPAIKAPPKPSATELASAKSAYEKLAKEADIFKALLEEGAISKNDAEQKQLAAHTALKHWESLRS
jgi:hypothetical protein